MNCRNTGNLAKNQKKNWGMSKKKIISIVGARPQFVKLAGLSCILRHYFKEAILHTGQHSDDEMSALFFRQLEINKPSYNLGVSSQLQGEQLALMIFGIEKILLKERPDFVLVYGDTNSTLAGALAARKINIPIGHIEAGARSYNKMMPEEINRVVADHLSDLLFCSSKNCLENLNKEGVAKNIYVVGDIMKDVVCKSLPIALRYSRIIKSLQLNPKNYYLATIHRAENVDNPERLRKIVDILDGLKSEVILPLHPRTEKMLKRFKIKLSTNIKRIIPVSYFDMLVLEKNAMVILTDSGGVQKEAFFLRTPCITLRDETEWLETVACKMNIVTGVDSNKVLRAINIFSTSRIKSSIKDPYGDGYAANKITRIIKNFLSASRI